MGYWLYNCEARKSGIFTIGGSIGILAKPLGETSLGILNGRIMAAISLTWEREGNALQFWITLDNISQEWKIYEILLFTASINTPLVPIWAYILNFHPR